MSHNERIINATPEQIIEVLSDGWNYADWVVGAVHVRAVDANWPAPGSQVHHRIGAWPFTINDSTQVVDYDPAGSLTLHARLRPFGEAEVRLRWTVVAPGSCRVRMTETFVRGAALLLPNMLADAALHARNTESLMRLDHLTRKYATVSVGDPAGA